MGVQRRDTFIPKLGLEDPSEVQSILYGCLPVSLTVRPGPFLEIIRVARNCAHSMRLQTMGSNPLSGSIICPFVCPSICPVVRGPFAIFVFVLISRLGVQGCYALFSKTLE